MQSVHIRVYFLFADTLTSDSYIYVVWIKVTICWDLGFFFHDTGGMLQIYVIGLY